MWIFADFGLLMPATIPAKYVTEGTQNTLQVRGRVKRHVERFAELYMEPGTYEDIYETPDMDYNVRFHTTPEAFAAGMTKAFLAIDYEKFKPTAERFEGGKVYHDVLNSIWATVCRLGSPGGKWGTYSETNPRGYKPRAKGTLSTYAPVTRDNTIFQTAWSAKDGDTWSGVDDYTPTSEDIRDDIITELTYDGIPLDQWQDYLNEHEWYLVKDYVLAALKPRRRNRRQKKSRINIRNKKMRTR